MPLLLGVGAGSGHRESGCRDSAAPSAGSGSPPAAAYSGNHGMLRAGRRPKHRPVPPWAGTPALVQSAPTPVRAVCESCGCCCRCHHPGGRQRGALQQHPRQGELIQAHTIPPSLWPETKAANLKLEPTQGIHAPRLLKLATRLP